MGNIKFNKFLALLLCLIGCSSVNAQVVLQSETWANSPSNTTNNVFLYEPTSNVFLMHENTVTSVPNDATMFTFSGKKDNYKISYVEGSRTMYVYNIKGDATWGATNNKPWAVEGVTGGYRIFQQEHNPKDDAERATKRDIKINGTALEYNKYTENDYSALQFISEEQYNAAYPQAMIRKALGNNQVACGSWYSTTGLVTETYLSPSGMWLSKVPVADAQKGVRVKLDIAGLVDAEYDIEFYVHGIINGATQTTYPDNAELQVSGTTTEYRKFTTYRGFGEDYNAPQVPAVVTVRPKNGNINIGIWVNAVARVYAGIKSIKYHNPSWGVPAITNSEDYYLYNVGTGNYLDIGGTWARQAVAGHGFALKGNVLPNGNYTFQSFVQRDAETDTYLYMKNVTGVFLDGKVANNEKQEFTPNVVGENVTLKHNSQYLAMDPATGYAYGALNATDEYSQWRFQTFAERKADLQRASSDNPMDATFLIKVPGFDLDDAKRSFNNWTGYNAGTDPEHPLMGQVRKTYYHDSDFHPVTVDMFKGWNGFNSLAKINNDRPYWDALALPAKNVAAGNTIYGSGNVANTDYANLTGLKTLRIKGTPGLPLRILLNRQADNSLTELTPTIGPDGYVDVEFTRIVDGNEVDNYPYVHLNAIKINGGSPSGSITEISYQYSHNTMLTALEINKPAFDIYQEITDVPEGFYLLSAQGVHIDPLGLNPVVELYANDGSTKILSAETNRDAAFDKFKDGDYKAQVIAYVGADHTLTIGARSKATDGTTLLDNFELTYFGKSGANFIDVTDMYIKNPGFQGSSTSSNWKDGWVDIENFSETLGNATNFFAGNGYFVSKENSSGKGHVQQNDILLPAGAYRLSATVVAQNTPASLFVTIDGRKQKTVFIDTLSTATVIELAPKRRELMFILPQSTTVSLGCEYFQGGNGGYRWVAADNFKLEYLGDVKGFDITCQMVNPNMDDKNMGLPEASYGWNADGSTGFTYKDVVNKVHGDGQIYNPQHSVDTYQTVTGLPNGWYKVHMQGFYRDASTADKYKNRKRAFLYANNTYTQIKNSNENVEPNPDFLTAHPQGQGYPQDLSEAATSFSAGLYDNNETVARVTDGALRIGISRDINPKLNDGADWIVVNKFVLTYLYNDTEIPEDAEFTQFIKNPSFETRSSEGWTVSSKTQVVDNLDDAVMTNGDGRYLANTGSPRLNYYYVRQKIKGGENGLPQGTYALKVKFASTPNNRITMSANGRMDSTKIALSLTDAKEFVLNGIGINNNEEIDIEFASNFGFKIDDVRLVKGEKEGDGVAIDRDLEGLIEKARIILGSDFVGHQPLQINGDNLQTALDYALTINDNSHYRDRKAAKDGLMAEIRALETAEVNAPVAGQDYMVNHVVSDFYLSTKDSKVDIEAYPAKLHFTAAGDGGYYISDASNDNKKILKAPEGNALSADASNGTKVYIKVVFIENVPSHYAISTVTPFDVDACLGTVNSTLSGAPVYAGQDGYDGMSRWFISNWSAPAIAAGENYYLYNVEAGAFLTNQGDNTDFGWGSHAAVNGGNPILWSLNEAAGAHEDGSFILEQAKGTGNRKIFVANDGNYGIGMYVDGANGTNYKFTSDTETGYYTIGIDANDATYGPNAEIGGAKYGDTFIGWAGEDNARIVIPCISAGDTEPRGTHWILCKKNQFDLYSLIVPTAYEARRAAWQVYRSALRSAAMVDVSEFAGVYNNPLATSEEIEDAADRLRTLMTERSKRATTKADGFVDLSFYTTDLDCQETDLAEGGWSVDGDIHFMKDKAARHNDNLTFGAVFYESWITRAENLPDRSLTRTVSGLPEGYYTAVLDAHAEKQDNAADVTGVELFLLSGKQEAARTISTPGDRNFGTYVTDTIRVLDGATLTLGVRIKDATANWVAFDNFRLRYCGPLRDHWTDVAPNTQKTINFTGTWRDTEEDEIKDIITTEGKGVTIDMEDAKILDPIDITLTTPDNVLVYVPAGADVTINGEDKNVIKDGDCTEFYVTDLVTLNIYKQFKAHKIYYSRKLTSTSNGVTTSWSYASLVLPYRLHTNSDVQVYRLVEGDGNGRFYIERISDNEAGVPALMRKKNPEATTIEINEESVEGIDVVTTTEIPWVMSTDGKLKLIGSYIYDTVIGNKNYKTDDPNMVGKWANNYYYFKNDKFVRGKDYFYCDAFRTYIDVTQAPSQVRSRTEFELSEWEETNGIDSNESDTYIEIDEVYNTNGIQKQGISKGINIVKMSNGQIKKIFVK